MPGKRVQFDDETWQVLDLLARDRVMDFQELAGDIPPPFRAEVCSQRTRGDLQCTS
jgi:hypothetical protein